MTENTKRIFFGVLLVLAGGIFLLQQIFNLPVGSLFIALLFAAGGAFFIYMLLRDRTKWWAAIPGFTLLGLGVLIAAGELVPVFADRFGGTLFLGAIALSFVAILLMKPEQWWPIIPAGVLLTLAVVAGLRNNGMASGAVFFLGVGATFAAVALLPMSKQEKWPWIPAGICLALGVLLLVGSGALVNTFFGWIWALAFVAVGAFLVIRSLVKK